MSARPEAPGTGAAPARRLQIAVVAACPLPAGRGTPIRIFRLAEAMAARGHAPEAVTYHLGEPHPVAGFPIHRIRPVRWYTRTEPGPSPGKLWLDARLAARLRKLLMTGRFDVIHAHHFEGMLCALAANRGIGLPILFDVHTLLASELPAYPMWLPKNLKRAIGKRLDVALPRYAAHVVAVSEQIEQTIRVDSGVPAGKVSVVPNGTEAGFLAGGKRLAGERPTVLFTGNLAAYQDVDLLLEAFALLRPREPAPLLRIVTDDDFSACRPLVQRLGIANAVRVVPAPLADLPNQLASADVAVNPRRVCDGVPQKLLNYMAAGCPVVSYEGSARHVIHGESAWIVREPTAAALAKGIDALLDDRVLAASLGARAARVVHDQLGWDRAAGDIEEICRRVLSAR